MRHTACLVVNPFMVASYASLFNCTTVALFFLTLARSGFRFSQEYLSLLHHSDKFDFGA